MRRSNLTRRTRTAARICGWLLGGAIGLASAAPALAQPMMLGGPPRPPISTKEFERFVEVLSLDEGQAEIARSLFEAMLTDYEAIRSVEAEQMEMLQEEFEDSRDPAVFEDMMPVQERSRKKIGELESRFMDDLRLVISDDQAGRWDSLERMRRRDKSLGGGMGVSGAAVDLIAIVEGLEVSEALRGELTGTLERYEVDLDRALVDRNRLKDEQEKQFRESHQPGEGGAMSFDIEAFQASAAAMREAEIKIRDINQRYSAQLGGMLDEATRAEFDRMIRVESFPQVYKRSYTGRAFDRAGGFDDLSDEQRSQLEMFREQYERELAAVNDKWAAAEAEAEAAGASQRMMLGGGNMIIQVGGGTQDEGVKAARAARKDLDDRYYDRVKQLMTPEQVERLPRKRRGPGDGFFAPDGLEGDMAVFVTQEIIMDDEEESGDN